MSIRRPKHGPESWPTADTGRASKDGPGRAIVGPNDPPVTIRDNQGNLRVGADAASWFAATHKRVVSAWHMIQAPRRDGRQYPADGEWEKWQPDGHARGFMSSESVLTEFWHGSTNPDSVALVRAGGQVWRHWSNGEDEHPGWTHTRRLILARVDLAPILHRWGRGLAADTAPLWEPSPVVHGWIQAGGDALAESAREEAKAAIAAAPKGGQDGAPRSTPRSLAAMVVEKQASQGPPAGWVREVAFCAIMANVLAETGVHFADATEDHDDWGAFVQSVGKHTRRLAAPLDRACLEAATGVSW